MNKYKELRLQYKLTHGTLWGSEKKIFGELALFYRVHPNTIEKIVDRGKHQDFAIHESTRKDYRTFACNLRKPEKRSVHLVKALERKAGIVRYEKEHAGELGHIDVHKARNVKGCDPKKKKYLATLVDDATRIAFSCLLPNKRAKTLALFLRNAVKWFEAKGIVFKAILTDNGKEFTTHSVAYKYEHSFEKMVTKLNIKHRYTRVRRPQTNGKVERWWRISEERFFRINVFASWKDLNKSFHDWLAYCNYRRPHGGIRYMTPWEKHEKSLSKT